MPPDRSSESRRLEMMIVYPEHGNLEVDYGKYGKANYRGIKASEGSAKGG